MDHSASSPVSLAPIDFVIFILYIAGIVALGVYASRFGVKTKRDYFLAGDKIPWWMVGGSIVAANISSHHLIGAMGLAYNRGFIAVVVEWGAILIGFNALLWIFLPFYLRNGFYTMPEFLDRRFGTGSRMAFATLILLTYLFVEIGAVLWMGAIAMYSLLDIPIVAGIVILAVVTGIYTVLGGLRAVIWTEMLQLAVLMMGGIALSAATIYAFGGFEKIWETSDEWHLLLPANDPDFPWTMYLGGSLCTSIFYCAANQFIVQRVLAAKDEWHARMGVVFTCYLKFLIPLIIIIPGLAASKMFPGLEKPDMVFPTLVKNLLPSGLVGLVMAGLIAAVMGHISGAVNSCSTIATIDFYLPIMKWYRQRFQKTEKSSAALDGSRNIPLNDDRQAVFFGRCFGVVTIILGILFATVLTQHSDKPVFLFLLNAYGYFTPGIATMFLMGIFWKRATQAGAITAGVLTIFLSLWMNWYTSGHVLVSGIPFQNRTGIVFWVCMTVCFLVSLFTKPKPEEEISGLVWNVGSLKLPREFREKARGFRNPFFWWVLITAIVVSFYIVFP